MEIQVKVEKILDAQRFTGKKDPSKEYVKYSFIGETQEQYAKKIKFDVSSQNFWERMGIEVGGVYNVSFDISSREWKGKYFTEVQAWKAVCVSGGSRNENKENNAAPNGHPCTTSAQDSSGKNDDMPF